MSSVQVQCTNDSSILSKRSMVEIGYFKDQYVSCFAHKFSRRSPLINLGYFVRAIVVESFLKHFLTSVETKSQILSLGAGFDTSFFRLHDYLNNTLYCEIDFPEVTACKITCIRDNEILKQKIINSNNSSFEGSNYTSDGYVIIGQDLSDLKSLEKNLLQAGFDFQLPTLLFSECAITYMPELKSTQLIKWAAENFPNAVFLTYEQINPNDGFGQVMKKHFKSINSPLNSVDLYQSLAEQTRRYLSCGWDECSSICAYDAYSQLLSDGEHHKILRLEPFDEWEEWHLKCCHYASSIACNGSLGHFIKPYTESLSPTRSDLKTRTCLQWTLKDISLERFGHCVIPVDRLEEVLLIIGGFGKISNKQHCRIKEPLILQLNGEICHHKIPIIKNEQNSIFWDAMFHSCAVLSKTDYQTEFILYGGRSSPLKPVNTSPHFITTQFNNNSLDIKTEEIKVKGEGPTPRWRHTLEIIDNCLLLFGGRTTDLKVLGDLWTLDLFKKPYQWCQLETKSDSPCCRFSHSSTSSDSQLLIAGGLDANFRPLSDVWSFSKDSNSWKRLLTPGLLPRYGHTSHTHLGCLIFVGGVNTLCDQQPGVGIVSLATGVTIEYSLPVIDPEFPIMLHNHCSILKANTLWVVGGGGNCFSFGTSFNKFVISIPLEQFHIIPCK